MRLAILTELGSLNGKLLGYIGIMSYQYCNLCTKAEASSLLSLEVDIAGKDYHIEDLAKALVHEKERDGDNQIIDLYPLRSEFITFIVKGIMKEHPEFKISFMKYKEDVPEDEDTMENQYIRLTMPDVDKERHDLIMDAIDVLHTTCKVKMDAAIAKVSATIAKYSATDDAKSIDEAKEKLEMQKKEYEDMREQLTEDKKKEVEEAYADYIAKQIGKDSTTNTNGNDGKSSMAKEPEVTRTSPTSTNQQSSSAKPEAKTEVKKDTPENKEESKNPFGGIGQSLSME